MGYKPDPREEPPVFAPIPKSHVPPPEQNEPPNVDHPEICVWFIFPGVYDPISKMYLPPDRLPEQGMWDPDLPIPDQRDWEYYIPCDELEKDQDDPGILFCIIPKNPGPGQNMPFCGKLYPREGQFLDRVTQNPSGITSDAVIDAIEKIFNRLGMFSDDPLAFLNDYEIYPVPLNGTCEDCKKWWVGCYRLSDFPENCGFVVGPEVFNQENLETEEYYNGIIFGGKAGYAQAQTFFDQVSKLYVWRCQDGFGGKKECLFCNGYCNEGYSSKEECECECLPEEDRPSDCPTRTPTPTPSSSHSNTPTPTATPNVTPTPTPTEYYTGPQSIFHVP